MQRKKPPQRIPPFFEKLSEGGLLGKCFAFQKQKPLTILAFFSPTFSCRFFFGNNRNFSKNFLETVVFLKTSGKRG